ncbi:hypothetical protein [Bacillus thuringiensis]|uniref:hypothetical protein n=1 Tax=Bacillus thuringiensis TaxID=1428 RepID=UPI000BF84201|nr:hypothetical protein [Bacillus thuringiensis]PFC28481.1 hypothetical protein CN299_19620 [Bacillus thuringiensis]
MKTKRQQLISVLRGAGDEGVTNAELSKIALRYGGYLGELYKRGYQVDKISEGNGVYRYILKHEPPVEQINKKTALDVLVEEIETKFNGHIDVQALPSLLESIGVSMRYKAGTHQGGIAH